VFQQNAREKTEQVAREETEQIHSYEQRIVERESEREREREREREHNYWCNQHIASHISISNVCVGKTSIVFLKKKIV